LPLDVEIPLLDVRRLPVVWVNHARTILVAPGDIERGWHETILRQTVVPFENACPWIDWIGAQLPGAAPSHVGGLAQRRAAEAVEQVAFVVDTVGAAQRPFFRQAIGKADTWAEIAQAPVAERAPAGADGAFAGEVVCAQEPGCRIHLVRIPARDAVPDLGEWR